MQIKTVKLEPGEYTNFTDEFTLHDVILFTGARGAGKSYPCAKFTKKYLIDNPTKKFVYMRISKDELATFEGWCKDLDILEIAEGADTAELRRGTPTKGDICLIGFDVEGQQCYKRVIGKCISLESSALNKSGNFDDFDIVVFEEYARYKINPKNERDYVRHFLENVETIFRKREKRIYLMANNLKSIPLLENAIEEEVITEDNPEGMFLNPLKIKIFRRSNNVRRSKFRDYLNGELYDDDDFTPNIDEFFKLYSNSDYMLYQHMVYSKKFYVTANKNKEVLQYREPEFLKLKYFCQGSATNEFYYQNNGVEKAFSMNYPRFLSEVTKFMAVNGSRFFVA